MPKSLSKSQLLLLSLLAALLPLELLFDIKNVFYIDWLNHVWTIAYYGDYFRAHGSFPDLIHTPEITGMVNPVFYGHFFYLVCGFIARFVGADAAIRILVVALMFGQFFAVFRMFELYSRNRRFSVLIAFVLSWATYPLTNLYSRSALTEFVAVGCLQISICFFMSALAFDRGRLRVREISRAFLFFTLAALVHPITGTMGGLTMVLVYIVIYFTDKSKREIALPSILGGVVSLLILSPWLYALFLFAKDLPINQMGDLVTYDFDTILSRLSPFPFDNRSLTDGRNVSTPHLDAQLNMALVALLAGLWLAFRKGGEEKAMFFQSFMSKKFTKVTAILSGILLVYLFFVSLGYIPRLVPQLIRKSQLGYRLITYQNLCLMFLALAATQVYANRKNRRDFAIAGFAAAIALSGAGLLLKLSHATVVRDRGGPWQTPIERITLPKSFYYLSGYNVIEGVKDLKKSNTDVNFVFQPASVESFGSVTSGEINLAGDAVVKTNVYVFPWNKIYLDGNPVKVELHHYEHGAFLATFTAKAGKHVVEYRWEPDGFWRNLRVLGFAILVLWIAGELATLVLFRKAT